MCGIAGVANKPGHVPQQSVLDRLCASLAHRGPDGHGTVIAGATGLAHTRLAIIDPAGGQQPLYGPMGTLLVGNGEIYNHIELWPEIAANQPRTRSDFEVPLHLCTASGESKLDRLRGMYAFAVASADGSEVTLARDPFGIKPLYYTVGDSGVSFASEPQALIGAGFATRSVDEDARDQLIDIRYINNGNTAFAGISRVLPGESIVIRDGEIHERHLRTAIPRPSVLPADENALLNRFDNVFEESVDVHRRADVPYGLFLSSGLDSTAILAMLTRVSGTPPACFTIGFDGAGERDERPAAARMARLFRAEHVEVPFSESDFWDYLPQVAGALDDPTADYAALPTFKLASVARKHGLKVILSGEGGDELFAGYGRHRQLMKPWYLGGRSRARRSELGRYGLLPEGGALGWTDQVRTLDRQFVRPWHTRLQAAQAIDIGGWLPGDILLKLDRCLMAHGIEGRTPFLDPEVAAFAFHLPDEMKVRNGYGKWLLRRWMEWRCPAAAPFAAKSGFTVPVQTWIARRKGELALLVSRQPGVASFCTPEKVNALFLDSGNKKRGLLAWSLLFYAVWHSIHICGGKAQDGILTLLKAG